MFINKQNDKNKEYYERMHKAAGSLSNLFSDSPQPYLGYRLVENLFCKSFDAQNLSRSDCSVDAAKEKLGVGLKTFLYKNGRSFEKIAEFNRELDLFRGLNPEQMVAKVAEMRNKRLEFTRRNYNLDNMIYHCVVRDKGKILVYETPMPLININDIKGIAGKRNIIKFGDGINYYTFNISKSTLFKQFTAENILLDFSVKIIENPFEALEKLFAETVRELVFAPVRQQAHVFLPLYSGRTGEKEVPERSGLNQWNASGRPRNPNEIYIPIPAWIHKAYPGFFPPRDASFNLLLPNSKKLSAKVCQDNSKALMSNPNSALGEWLLRDVLKLKEGELLTYEKLETIGLDSAVIYKINDETYDIDFARIGSYEQFSGDDESSIDETDESN